MTSQENNEKGIANRLSMDRDTFIRAFSDFDAARENAAEIKELEINQSKKKQTPAAAEVPLSDIQSRPEELGMERKIPRQMHVWFAAGLGLLACFATLAQGLLSGPQAPPVRHDDSSTVPLQDSEPPLTKLQQEFAHQRNDDSENSKKSGDALSGHEGVGRAFNEEFTLSNPSKSRRTKRQNTSLASAEISPSDLMADFPGQLPPGKENSSDLMRRYETDKARALISGSKMLAVNHSLGGVFGLSELSTTNLPSQISSLVQSSPKMMKGFTEAISQIPRPKMLQTAQSNANVMPISALAPRPHSPGALVLEGTAIPCVLLTELRSDLPGMVVAQISEDVFDSLHAEVKVIPRGARLIGRYDSHISSGQQRLMASFHRLILPNGTSVELEKMEGADADGSSGLKGDVDTHFWARFGQAFLTAGLARAVQPPNASIPSNSFAGSVLGPNAAGQILIDTTRINLQANGLLQPTIMIHQGDPFVVMVNRDLALPALSVN
jgi:hypothetical protein